MNQALYAHMNNKTIKKKQNINYDQEFINEKNKELVQFYLFLFIYLFIFIIHMCIQWLGI
jgi:hypothetical protein